MLGIIRIGQGWLTQFKILGLSGILGYAGGGLASDWGNTIKSLSRQALVIIRIGKLLVG